MQDERINYEVLSCVEPSHLSPSDSLGYSLIKHTTKQIYPDSIPIPGVMLGINCLKWNLLVVFFLFIYFY